MRVDKEFECEGNERDGEEAWKVMERTREREDRGEDWDGRVMDRRGEERRWQERAFLVIQSSAQTT